MTRFIFRTANLREGVRRLVRNPAFLGCSFWLLVVGIAWAADCFIVGEQTGQFPLEQFGFSLAFLGDVNADGATVDFAVGAPGTPGSTFPIPGNVYVFSGADGSLIYPLSGEALNDRFGVAVARLGDVTGDGIPDFVVGADMAEAQTDGPVPLQDAGKVYGFDGVNGSPLWVLEGQFPRGRFGFSLDGGVDLNSDGRFDLIVGAPQDAGSADLVQAGAAYAFATIPSITPIMVTRGEATGDAFGHAVRFLSGDVNHDGVDDILVGAPFADGATAFDPGLVDVGSAYVVSGATGQHLLKVSGDAASQLLGTSLAPTGDVNCDDVADFAVGIPGIRTVRVYSGLSGQPLYEIQGPFADEAFGHAIATDRANLPGIPSESDTDPIITDLIIGSPDGSTTPFASPGSFLRSSARSGLPVCTVQGFFPGERFGWAVESLGRQAFLVGAPMAQRGPMAPTGAVRLVNVQPGPPPGQPVIFSADGDSEAVTLAFGPESPTCAAFDFGVYVGGRDTLGDALTDHAAYTCSTGGGNSITIPAAAWPPNSCVYFVVTALTDNEEGTKHPPDPCKQPGFINAPCRAFVTQAACP